MTNSTWSQCIIILIYSWIFFFFLPVLGLLCVSVSAQAFSSCSAPGLLFVVVLRVLIAVASLAVGAKALGLRVHDVSSCGTQAQ